VAEAVKRPPKITEGLLALVWFADARRGGSLGIADCDSCKASTPALQRQHLGCGYEPRLDDGKFHLTIWQPPEGYRGPELSTCAGYTTRLPEVVEVDRLHSHWSHGNMAAVLGEPATEEIATAVLVVESQIHALKAWKAEESKK
jgi:hypothetical protein